MQIKKVEFQKSWIKRLRAQSPERNSLEGRKVKVEERICLTIRTSISAPITPKFHAMNKSAFSRLPKVGLISNLNSTGAIINY